jgi:hypothetical protein
MRPFRFTAALLALAALGCPGQSTTSAPAPAPPPPSSDTTKGAPASPGGKAAAPPFDKSTMKSPWKGVAVGDWAVYRMESAKVKQVRFEVTAVDDTTVSLVRKNVENGAVLGEWKENLASLEAQWKAPDTYDGLAKDDKGQDIKPYKEKATVAGKELECTVLKRAGLGSTTELWMAIDQVLPVNQCAVKSYKDGKLELELLDFGRAK